MQRSPIQWTNFTSNPLRYRDPDGSIVHACIHASEGCRYCYAEGLAGRWGRQGKAFTAENMKHLTPFLDEKELHHMLTHKPASGKMCFPFDMTDLFGEWVPFELIDRVFAVMALREDVTWQILTKRADRMREYFTAEFRDPAYEITCAMLGFAKPPMPKPVHIPSHLTLRLPLKNVHLGVSVENQEWADKRIPVLLQTPATVRFVSYEPALGPVDFTRFIEKRFDRCPDEPSGECEGCDPINMTSTGDHCGAIFMPRLDWIIVGGESGSKARPFDVQWARDVVAQCKAAGVAVFIKQLGAKVRPPGSWDDFFAESKSNPHFSEWRIHSSSGPDDPAYLMLTDSHGGNPEEWPEDLRIRQWPKCVAMQETQ